MRFMIVFIDEGKIRSREVIAATRLEAEAAVQPLGIVVRVNEVCGGCEGLIAEGYESPLNGDEHYCEWCSALDAFAEADLDAIIIREVR